jgi:hypothetical protein
VRTGAFETLPLSSRAPGEGVRGYVFRPRT